MSSRAFKFNGSRWLSESKYMGEPDGDCGNRKDRRMTAAIERLTRKKALARKNKR